MTSLDPTARAVLHLAHDGCAATATDPIREPGGGAHGKTPHSSHAQLQDLVAYLETL